MSDSHRCIQDEVTPAGIDPVLAALGRTGIASVKAPDGSAWLVSERWGLSRFPPLASAAPSASVAAALFAHRHTWLLDFIVPAVDGLAPNASLYLYQRDRYTLDDLSKNARRDARKAVRELDIGWITHRELMANGFAAFADVRRRVGLSDGTREHFVQRFGHLCDVPGYHFIGAWKGDQLVSFLTLQAVGEWVSIAPYSDSTHRNSCPNDGLVHFALNHCINERGIKIVSYGLSSIQEESNAASLHEFKLKVGFEAVGVRRVFRVHPWAAPVVNRRTHAVIRSLVRLMPRNRLLKKGSGALLQILAQQQGDASAVAGRAP